MERFIRRWVLLGLVSSTALFSAGSAWADAQVLPLWEVTGLAEKIVVAEVRNIVEPDPDVDGEPAYSPSTAVLRVRKTLKGEHEPTVEVKFQALMICPSPPRYVQGEIVVAFLSSNQGDDWWTVGSSYGTHSPAGDDLDDLISLVLWAIDIQGTEYRASEKVDWLVAAAVIPSTRWHGLYDLVPGNDSVLYGFDRTAHSRAKELSKKHRRVLARALLDTPIFDRTFHMMLLTVSRLEDPAIDRLAVAGLEGLFSLEEPPWWLGSTLWTVLGRFGDPHPSKRLEARGVDPYQATPEDYLAVWTRAKLELEIPDTPAASIDPESFRPASD